MPQTSDVVELELPNQPKLRISLSLDGNLTFMVIGETNEVGVREALDALAAFQRNLTAHRVVHGCYSRKVPFTSNQYEPDLLVVSLAVFRKVLYPRIAA